MLWRKSGTKPAEPRDEDHEEGTTPRADTENAGIGHRLPAEAPSTEDEDTSQPGTDTEPETHGRKTGKTVAPGEPRAANQWKG